MGVCSCRLDALSAVGERKWLTGCSESWTRTDRSKSISRLVLLWCFIGDCGAGVPFHCTCFFCVVWSYVQEFVCAAFIFHSGSREQQLRRASSRSVDAESAVVHGIIIFYDCPGLFFSLAVIFQMFDLDHDDFVSRKEFQKMMEAVIVRGRDFDVEVPKPGDGGQFETITMESLSDLSSGMAEMAIDAVRTPP